SGDRLTGVADIAVDKHGGRDRVRPASRRIAHRAGSMSGLTAVQRSAARSAQRWRIEDVVNDEAVARPYRTLDTRIVVDLDINVVAVEIIAADGEVVGCAAGSHVR